MNRGQASKRSLAVRVYAGLLRRSAHDLDERYRQEATEVFLELYQDARQRRGRPAALGVLVRAALALVTSSIGRRHDHGSTRTLSRRAPSGLGADLRLGLRGLRKHPSFTVPAVLILGIGIGSTTTIFSVVDTVVLRELPYPNAGRLVFFDDGDHSYPSYRAWSGLSSFEALSALSGDNVDLVGEGPPQRLFAAFVSEAFFPMLGGSPATGRLFDTGDYPDAGEVVVLSHALWVQMGRDPSIVGRSLRIDGQQRTVVGVLDGSFETPEIELPAVDVWMPLPDGGAQANNHGFSVLSIVARLAPGVSLEAAQDEVDAQRAAFAREFPDQYLRRDGSVSTIPIVPLREATVRNVRGRLLTALGAVGLLLLIACANVANLFLARGTSRAREVALHCALGAGRARVVRRLLAEATLLALIGGSLGIALANVGVAAFRHFNPGRMPRIEALSVDLRILGFTLLASIGTALLFGLLPALQVARATVGDVLKEAAASVTASRAGRRARNGLVVTQIALALVLLTSAGLLFRSFNAMLQVEPGFEADGLFVLPLEVSGDQRVAFARELVEAVRGLPGVTAATAGVTIPFTRTGNSRCCWGSSAQGDPALYDFQNPARFNIQMVAEDYFRTLGADLTGRELTRSDEAGEPPVAVLNASAARALFGTENAVGREVEFNRERFAVVGVENDLHHWGLNQPPGNNIYVPYARFAAPFGLLNLAIRSSLPLETLAPALRQTVWGIAPDLPIGPIETMEQRMSGSLASPRFLALLFGVFAAVSLLLACAGIYSSMLYTVGQRASEMGIRQALGAGGGAIVSMVLRSGLAITILGILIGEAAALAASRVVRALLWNVPPTDPITYAVAGAVLAITALLACLLPALKASRTNPVATLRGVP